MNQKFPILVRPHDSIEKNTPASVPIVTAALILQRYLNVGLLRTEEEGHW